VTETSYVKLLISQRGWVFWPHGLGADVVLLGLWAISGRSRHRVRAGDLR